MAFTLRLLALSTYVYLGTVAGSGQVYASVGKHPRLETDCLLSRTVLRPEFGSSLDDLRPGERMPLVQVRICRHQRRTCVAYGEEVPPSRCAANPIISESLGILTTE